MGFGFSIGFFSKKTVFEVSSRSLGAYCPFLVVAMSVVLAVFLGIKLADYFVTSAEATTLFETASAQCISDPNKVKDCYAESKKNSR